MRGAAALVLSVVDARTEIVHLVRVEAAALHRRSGRYPALCGVEVLSASMLAKPGRQCEDCQTRAREGAGTVRQRGQARPRRAVGTWRGNARRRRRSRRRRPDTREGDLGGA